MKKISISAVVFTSLMFLGASAQAQNQNAMDSNQPRAHRASVVSRTTRAIKYAHRSGATKINFRGTDLMPAAAGQAKVESKRGAMEVEVEFSGLDRPTTFGNEYLTYVLWAISSEGRPVNIGEVLVGSNHRSKLDVTTDLQAFALIVTAEPYYAVRQPSNVVVLENEIRPDTVGTSEAVDANYELIDRGGYLPTGYKFDPVVLNSKLPLEFFEARNAMRIAKSAGADQYATSSYDDAVHQMKEADELATQHHVDKKPLISMSRQVVQTAEDSREIAIKNMDTERLDADRNASQAREDDATEQSRKDKQGRINAETATADADRLRQEADRATATAQQQQLNAQADSDRSRDAAADANKAAANAKQGQEDAEADSARNQAATADAQQGQKTAEAQSDRDRASAASSDLQLQQAVRDREELRARLLQQFNAILTTRDTARGLVVNMSDVLFDTGQYTLRPQAREKLAKISGIVLAYPDLRLAIEGNTDSVGGETMNQTLSERRAGAVMDYLAKQNIPAASMTSRGFGMSQPIASNDTAEGRQQNRRVELVVSGDVIGTTIGTLPTGASDNHQ
ncbi:MAG: OmpA family protein [Candidatus Acidiferrales bacterium]